MSYDLAILGSGPGGYTAALRASLRGLSVALVESGELGGTCLNVGCIPTKTMLHASGLAWEARHAKAIGLIVSDLAVDADAFAQRVAQTVSILRKGVAGLLAARKVDVRSIVIGPDASVEPAVSGRGALPLVV